MRYRRSTTVLGFKWGTLAAGSELQVENCSVWLTVVGFARRTTVENYSNGIYTEYGSDGLQMENVSGGW